MREIRWAELLARLLANDLFGRPSICEIQSFFLRHPTPCQFCHRVVRPRGSERISTYLSTTLPCQTRQLAFTPPSATLFHAQPISGQPATPSSPLPLYLFAIPRSSSSFFSLPTVGRRIQRFTQRPVHGCEIFLPALAYLLLPGSC